MLIIGITGSIAMGKSTAASMLSKLNIPIHDADKTVHQLFRKNGGAYNSIAKIFPETIGKNGVDRIRLGREVFGNPDRLAQLENIVHPLVSNARDKFIQGHRRRKSKLVILDVPLLYETGGDKGCDKVMVVSAPAFLQKQRALSRPNMSLKKFSDILSHQMPNSEKCKRADYVVQTGLGKAYTYCALKGIIYKLRTKNTYKHSLEK
jgi:dephospho-CoA kinase